MGCAKNKRKEGKEARGLGLVLDRVGLVLGSGQKRYIKVCETHLSLISQKLSLSSLLSLSNSLFSLLSSPTRSGGRR